MVADTLALTVREQLKLAEARFRLGSDELREPDYLQLMAWADQLKLDPLEVLRRLKSGLRFEGDETVIENGSFIKLHWDPGLLPLSEFQICQRLRLTQLSFMPIESVADLGAKEAGVSPTDDLPPGYDLKSRILNISTAALPELKRLGCGIVGLERLAVGQAASLESLDCLGNYLEQLDLISFPNLKTLNCLDNRRLTDLNLAHVPQLLELDCQMNLIEELDLRPVTKLRKLNCSDNDMKELVLPNLPDLVELECSNSSWDKAAGLGRYLGKIDLRGAANLEQLNCSDNMLTSLNLTCVPKLKHLKCSSNPLTELKLTDVPLLETLECYNIPNNWWSTPNPPRIGSLDIRGLRHLKELYCDNRTRVIQRPDQHFTA